MSIPLICHSQDTPVSEEGSNLFSRPWWTFLGNIARVLKGVRAATPGSALLVDADGNIVGGQIDVANANEIAATGFTDGNVPRWDGTLKAFAPDTRVPALSTVTVQCTATTTLSSTLADITGATFVLTTGTWLIRAHAYAFYNVNSTGVRIGLNAGGTDVDQQALGYPNPAMVSAMVTATGTDIWQGMMAQEWRLGIGGSVTVKLRGYKLTNAGTAIAGGVDTTMTAERVG